MMPLMIIRFWGWLILAQDKTCNKQFMNKKQRIITLTLLAWLVAANMTVFAEEVLPDMSSPFDVPASGSSDGAAIPSLTPKAETATPPNDGASDAPPSLSIKIDAPKADSGTKDSDVKKDNKVVSASKVKTDASDMTDKGNEVTSDGAQVISPKPKKMPKSGPEVAFLILPSLVLGYVYSRKRK